MNIVFSIAGVVFFIALSILLLCWAWSIVSDKLEEREERKRLHYRKEARHVWGQSICQDAYWLSENLAAYVTMKAVGEALMAGGWDMMSFRDELYKKIREEEKQQALRKLERMNQVKVGAQP